MPGETCSLLPADIRSSIAAPYCICYLAASDPQTFWPHKQLPLVNTPRRPFLLIFAYQPGPELLSLSKVIQVPGAVSSKRLGFWDPCVELGAHQCCNAQDLSQLSARCSKIRSWICPFCPNIYSLVAFLSSHSCYPFWSHCSPSTAHTELCFLFPPYS